jgi:hypothetical protein
MLFFRVEYLCLPGDFYSLLATYVKKRDIPIHPMKFCDHGGQLISQGFKQEIQGVLGGIQMVGKVLNS